MTHMFRAVIAEAPGPPAGYRLGVRHAIAPQSTMVRVRICAVALSYADMLAARGGHQVKIAPPFTPGSEFAGVVDAVGEDAGGFALGERVTGICASGALAEMVTVEVSALRHIPAGLGFEEAAALRVNTATALHALADRGTLSAGETLLVLGGAGGLGSAAIQIGKAIGAQVIAAASTADKRAFALSQGADHAIGYDDIEGREILRAMTDGRGLDVVLDPVGGPMFGMSFRSLAWRGRYLAVGFASGEIPCLPLNIALVKGASLIGVEIGRFAALEPTRARANEVQIEQWHAEGKIRPAIAQVFPLTAFREAMEAAFSGAGCGRVVVRMP